MKIRELTSRRPCAAAAAFIVALAFLAASARAQEVPDFGPASTRGVLDEVPRRPRDREMQPPPPEEGEVVVTGRQKQKPSRNWALNPAFVHSETAQVLGAELVGQRKFTGERSDQLLVGYTSVDPEGSAGPFDQAKFRYRNKFAMLESGVAYEAQAQFIKRWEKFVEESVQLKAGFFQRAPTRVSLALGYVWRDREGASTLSDRDVRAAITQDINRAGVTRVNVEYRLDNDVVGEDDFNVGVDFTRGWTVIVGKHWVSVLAYSQPLGGSGN